MAEGLTVKGAMGLLGLSRISYYRRVREMTDYRAHLRNVSSRQHTEVLREVALKRVEAGHRRLCRVPQWHHLAVDLTEPHPL